MAPAAPISTSTGTIRLALVLGVVGLMRPAVSAEGRRADRDLLVLAILLVGAALLSVLQHHLFGIAYLSIRRAVFLWPLFVLLSSSLFAAMRDRAGVWRWTVSPVLADHGASPRGAFRSGGQCAYDQGLVQ